MHVMCHMRRRIHACHVSYEEEDTCISCALNHLPSRPETKEEKRPPRNAFVSGLLTCTRVLSVNVRMSLAVERFCLRFAHLLLHLAHDVVELCLSLRLAHLLLHLTN